MTFDKDALVWIFSNTSTYLLDLESTLTPQTFKEKEPMGYREEE